MICTMMSPVLEPQAANPRQSFTATARATADNAQGFAQAGRRRQWCHDDSFGCQQTIFETNQWALLPIPAEKNIYEQEAESVSFNEFLQRWRHGINFGFVVAHLGFGPAKCGVPIDPSFVSTFEPPK